MVHHAGPPLGHVVQANLTLVALSTSPFASLLIYEKISNPRSTELFANQSVVTIVNTVFAAFIIIDSMTMCTTMTSSPNMMCE
jgi:hypothetical protein